MPSLPDDSEERKTYPLFRALFGYFGAALAGVAHHAWKSNEKHNPGQEMHWAVDKSTDHADCIMRHLLDYGDLIAAVERHGVGSEEVSAILAEVDALAWRALALNQSTRMELGLAPLPFNARRDETPWKPLAPSWAQVSVPNVSHCEDPDCWCRKRPQPGEIIPADPFGRPIHGKIICFNVEVDNDGGFIRSEN